MYIILFGNRWVSIHYKVNLPQEFPGQVHGARNISLEVIAMEVERKFLVEGALPFSLNVIKEYRILQGYVLLEGKNEARVRRRTSNDGEEFFLTIKAGTGLCRAEVEVPITSAQFKELIGVAGNRTISKTRYLTAEGYEVDLYHGRLNHRKVVEVEFGSEAEAQKFAPPAWFGAEVTEDKRYKNRALAIQG